MGISSAVAALGMSSLIAFPFPLEAGARAQAPMTLSCALSIQNTTRRWIALTSR
jgi:hypothetical protein